MPNIKLANKRILIIKQSSLGDIIHTLPVVHALKRCHHDCTIGWIVQKPFKDLLERDPTVDEVIPIDIPSTSDPSAKQGAYWKTLCETIHYLRKLRSLFKKNPYDIVLDLHASIRSAMLALTNPGGYRIGLAGAKELNFLFQHYKIQIPDNITHAVDKNLLFCEYLLCPITKRDFTLYTDVRDRDNVEHFLASQSGFKTSRPTVYVNPCTRWMTKHWLVERWAVFCDKLIQEAGCNVIIAGSRKDTKYITDIVSRMVEKPVVSAGTLSLTEISALLHVSIMYVGVDSGPMHMAAMSGIPVVALFGPTHPDRVKPYGVDHRIIQNKNIDCLECRKRECDDHSCMKDITVNMVYDAAMLFISNSSNK